MMNHCRSDVPSKRGRGYLIFIHVVFGGLIAVSLSLLFGFFVMLLWNAILPDLLGVRPMSYLQGVGLLLLCRILVGGVGCGQGGHHRRPHGSSRRDYDAWWEEIGEKSFRKFTNGDENK